MLSSDPHAWLRTFYARLLANSSFPLLAPAHQFEQLLWRVQKDSRELTCVARYLPSGMDVRLLEGDGFR